MHTHEGKTCRFHYNSDLSGGVIIGEKAGSDREVEISFADLAAFVRLVHSKEPKTDVETKEGHVAEPASTWKP